MKTSGAVLRLIRKEQRVAEKFCLTSIWLTSVAAILFSATSFAQSAIQINGMEMTAGAEEAGDASAPYTIFSNLDPNHDAYDSSDLFAKAVVGRQVRDMTEQWDAVRFVPKVDVQATVLEAGVGYIAGTRNVTLSLYDNDDIFQTPGSLLPGAQGSTTNIPDLGECCQLAKVVLPQPITLNAGTIYWLVVSPGSTDFNGAWQISHLGDRALLKPGVQPWIIGGGEWPAARVGGTRLQTLGPINQVAQNNRASERGAARTTVKIFSNLGTAFPDPYTPGYGIGVVGNDVQFYNEAWLALPFTPRANVRAKILRAAIGYMIGYADIVNLGIYDDNGGVPGTPLSGGQGTATGIPESGQCCDFATVRLPKNGVALSANVQYWLVASPSTDAENFFGIWQISTNNFLSILNPEQTSYWTDFVGEWMAAQIVGQSQ